MSLGEELFLLAMSPRRGEIKADDRLGYALRAAELTDLALEGHVEITATRIRVARSADVTDQRLRQVLTALKSEPHETSVKQWIQTSSRLTIREYLPALRDQGLISYEENRIGPSALRLTPAGSERRLRLRRRIDTIVGRDSSASARGSARDRALAGLVQSCGLDRQLYPGLRGRGARKRLASLADARTSDTITASVGETIAVLDESVRRAVLDGAAAAIREVSMAQFRQDGGDSYGTVGHIGGGQHHQPPSS